MEYDSPLFIAAVKKILRDSVQHLADGIENLKNAVSAHWQADEKRYQTKPITTADLRTDVPIPIENKTKKTIPEWVWVVFKGALEIAGVLAVILYTIVAYNNWQEQIDATNFVARQTELSRKILNETTKQTRREYRAWIKVTVGNALFTYGEPMVMPIRIENTGKTGQSWGTRRKRRLRSIRRH
jgi:hypothetical protein